MILKLTDRFYSVKYCRTERNKKHVCYKNQNEIRL